MPEQRGACWQCQDQSVHNIVLIFIANISVLQFNLLELTALFLLQSTLGAGNVKSKRQLLLNKRNHKTFDAVEEKMSHIQVYRQFITNGRNILVLTAAYQFNISYTISKPAV